jgi:hypothetical protein
MQVVDFNNMFENEEILSQFLTQERKRRAEFEGPINAPFKIVEQINGSQFKCRENGKPWSRAEPCVQCSDNECLFYLMELSTTKPEKYIRDGLSSFCKNPKNNELLRMLCCWRKHIKETLIIEKPYGSDKWKRHSICTFELTFLGRRTEMGGIIGIISLTNMHICSIPSLVSLMNKEDGVHNGVKCLSAGFVLLIAIYMEWLLYTEENKEIIERLLKKVRKGKLVGLDTYEGSPWYTMFKCVLERRRIPDKLKEIILSRAHLP